MITIATAELDGDSATHVGPDVACLAGQFLDADDRFTALLATTADGSPAGVVTLTEAVAAYAGGGYGILSELYVVPSLRGRGIGARLLEAVRHEAMRRGWPRVDVTALRRSMGSVVRLLCARGIRVHGTQLKWRRPAVSTDPPCAGS